MDVNTVYATNLVNYDKYKDKSKNEVFRIISWDLFSKCMPVPGKNPFIVEGYVLSDGQGDYSHMKSMKNALHKKFPDRKIISYIIGATKHEGKLYSSKKPWHEENIAYMLNVPSTNPTIKTTPFKENYSDTLDKIKQADLWISGPISVRGLYDSLSAEAAEKKIAFHEYDAFVNESYPPANSGFGMGLGLMAKGIFIKNLKTNYTYSSLENGLLKQLLFNNKEPSNESIEQYLAHHTLFFVYVSGINKRIEFIECANAFNRFHYKEKNMDIILPKGILSGDITKFLNKKTKEQVFPGVGTIKFISIDKEGEITQNEMKLNNCGTEMRLIDPGHLSPTDFKRLVCLSSPLVGCTGNTSVSQVLSYGKIPFYEGNLAQTHFFHHSLASRAEKYLGKESPLTQFLIKNAQRDPLANDALKNFDIIQDAKKFRQFLYENHNITVVVQGLANELLCRNKYPGFAKVQDEIKDKYLQEKISLQEVEDQLKTELQNINLLPKDN